MKQFLPSMPFHLGCHLRAWTSFKIALSSSNTQTDFFLNKKHNLTGVLSNIDFHWFHMWPRWQPRLAIIQPELVTSPTNTEVTTFSSKHCPPAVLPPWSHLCPKDQQGFGWSIDLRINMGQPKSIWFILFFLSWLLSLSYGYLSCLILLL